MVANVSWIPEPTARQELFLGPARVVSIEARSVRVRLPSGELVLAEMALAYPYEPAVDDVLLVIAHAEGRYVIGVVAGNGKLDLRFEGDVNLTSGGTLTLSAEKGVHVRAPELDVLAERLALVATAAVQKFATLHQRVTEMWSVRAGESQTIVDGTALQRARKLALVAEETASVNGKQILLG